MKCQCVHLHLQIFFYFFFLYLKWYYQHLLPMIWPYQISEVLFVCVALVGVTKDS